MRKDQLSEQPTIAQKDETLQKMCFDSKIQQVISIPKNPKAKQKQSTSRVSTGNKVLVLTGSPGATPEV